MFYASDQKIIYVVDNERLIGIITIGRFLECVEKKDMSNIIQSSFLFFYEEDLREFTNVSRIMEERNITTSVPVCSADGKFIYEMRRESLRRECVLRKLQLEFEQCQSSYYLKDECEYLREILEGQNLIVLGNESQFYLYFSGLFNNGERITFIDELADAYGFFVNILQKSFT